MKGKRVDNENALPYKMEIQAKGLTLPGLPKGVPSPADPIKHVDPGLGATTIAHPYKASKPKI